LNWIKRKNAGQNPPRVVAPIEEEEKESIKFEEKLTLFVQFLTFSLSTSLNCGRFLSYGFF
jgi:hypothetical protein